MQDSNKEIAGISAHRLESGGRLRKGLSLFVRASSLIVLKRSLKGLIRARASGKRFKAEDMRGAMKKDSV
jgi:hypothetical protein